MNITINGNFVNIIEQPTDIPGLKFKPQMSQYSNDEDWNYTWTVPHTTEVTKQSYDLVDTVCRDYMTHGIMEIGVSRNGPGSFTNALLNNKPDNIPYLGVDLDDKSYLNNEQKKVFTIRENSLNQRAIRTYAEVIGLEKISILFIDGWHSVNTVINDWLYSDMLSDNGIVIFHDTNSHPGPTVFVHAIDETIYKVVKHFEHDDDYGLSIAYRI